MLTEKQRTLLVFIHDCLNERGVSPSFDEMKDALSLKSKSGIHRLITALLKLVRRDALQLGQQQQGPGTHPLLHIAPLKVLQLLMSTATEANTTGHGRQRHGTTIAGKRNKPAEHGAGGRHNRLLSKPGGGSNQNPLRQALAKQNRQ